MCAYGNFLRENDVYVQNYGYMYPDDTKSRGISSHDIDLFFQGYSRLSSKMVNFKTFFYFPCFRKCLCRKLTHCIFNVRPVALFIDNTMIWYASTMRASYRTLRNLFALNKLKMANAGPMVTKSVSRFDMPSVFDSFKHSLYGLNADDIRIFG